MQQLGDPVDGRPSRRERTVRRPEGGVGNIDANLGTRATRTGRQAGRRGRLRETCPSRRHPHWPAASSTGCSSVCWSGRSSSSRCCRRLARRWRRCSRPCSAPCAPAAWSARACRRRCGPAGPGGAGGGRGRPGRRRVVILGGGFGGVSAAKRFEQLWTPWLDVTLVSQRNYLLFTPMLAEVAAGSVEAGNVGVPLRAACPRTRFRRAEVLGVDPDRQGRPPAPRRRPGDPALRPPGAGPGAVPNFRDLPGVPPTPSPWPPWRTPGGCGTTSSGGSSRPTTSPTRPRGAAGSPSSSPAAASPAPRPWPASSTWSTACSATSPRPGQRAPLRAGPLARPHPARAGRPAGRLRQRQAGRAGSSCGLGDGGRRRRRRGRAQRRRAGGGPHPGLGRRTAPRPWSARRVQGGPGGWRRAAGAGRPGRPDPAGGAAAGHLGGGDCARVPDLSRPAPPARRPPSTRSARARPWPTTWSPP